jgi:rsbT antagonist protein RsbS
MSEEISRLPIIKLWNQILVPLQGEITDALAERLQQNVLETILESGAEGLIIDVTGVWMIDSHLCSVISKMAAAAKLMGTRSVICGMSPEIALTLQTMGVDLTTVKTALSVEEAFTALGVSRAATPAKAELRTQGATGGHGLAPRKEKSDFAEGGMSLAALARSRGDAG